MSPVLRKILNKETFIKKLAESATTKKLSFGGAVFLTDPATAPQSEFRSFNHLHCTMISTLFRTIFLLFISRYLQIASATETLDFLSTIHRSGWQAGCNSYTSIWLFKKSTSSSFRLLCEKVNKHGLKRVLTRQMEEPTKTKLDSKFLFSVVADLCAMEKPLGCVVDQSGKKLDEQELGAILVDTVAKAKADVLDLYLNTFFPTRLSGRHLDIRQTSFRSTEEPNDPNVENRPYNTAYWLNEALLKVIRPFRSRHVEILVQHGATAYHEYVNSVFEEIGRGELDLAEMMLRLDVAALFKRTLDSLQSRHHIWGAWILEDQFERKILLRDLFSEVIHRLDNILGRSENGEATRQLHNHILRLHRIAEAESFCSGIEEMTLTFDAKNMLNYLIDAQKEEPLDPETNARFAALFNLMLGAARRGDIDTTTDLLDFGVPARLNGKSIFVHALENNRVDTVLALLQRPEIDISTPEIELFRQKFPALYEIIRPNYMNQAKRMFHTLQKTLFAEDKLEETSQTDPVSPRSRISSSSIPPHCENSPCMSEPETSEDRGRCSKLRTACRRWWQRSKLRLSSIWSRLRSLLKKIRQRHNDDRNKI